MLSGKRRHQLSLLTCAVNVPLCLYLEGISLKKGHSSQMAVQDNYQRPLDALNPLLQAPSSVQDDIAFVAQSFYLQSPVLDSNQTEQNNLTQLVDSLVNYAGTAYGELDQAGMYASLDAVREEVTQMQKYEIALHRVGQALNFSIGAVILSSIDNSVDRSTYTNRIVVLDNSGKCDPIPRIIYSLLLGIQSVQYLRSTSRKNFPPKLSPQT